MCYNAGMGKRRKGRIPVKSFEDAVLLNCAYTRGYGPKVWESLESGNREEAEVLCQFALDRQREKRRLRAEAGGEEYRTKARQAGRASYIKHKPKTQERRKKNHHSNYAKNMALVVETLGDSCVISRIKKSGLNVDFAHICGDGTPETTIARLSCGYDTQKCLLECKKVVPLARKYHRWTYDGWWKLLFGQSPNSFLMMIHFVSQRDNLPEPDYDYLCSHYSALAGATWRPASLQGN